MKYVALLSGGKDSCFNLVHCAANGHELVAAASLGPEQGKEELDSYLYQTVGQDAIELVARSLDVPLYRKTITGTAVNQTSEYGSRDAMGAGCVTGDETEDLYDLLFAVKTQHPDVQGVAVGAILSNYQRVRVEHVCSRLLLTPLCYLWQRDQDELLSEMIASGLAAVFIKVAGIGLSSRHLGRTLEAMQEELRQLNAKFGSHICGEGGEYETLTLDCPLFKQRVVLDEVEIVVHSDSDFATVAYLRIKSAHLADKQVSRLARILPPALLDEDILQLREAAQMLFASHGAGSDHSVATIGPPSEENPAVGESDIRTGSCRIGQWISVSNIQRADSRSNPTTIIQEVLACFDILQERLDQLHVRLADITHINVYLSDMTYFSDVNSVYNRFFGTSPPSRACVGVYLPNGTNVMLDCLVYDECQKGSRRALHVQGLSYWAPANIGPYSQAVYAGGRVFVSGQIGMLPSSLSLPAPPSLSLELALSCQHLSRITTFMRETHSEITDPVNQCVIIWLAGGTSLYSMRQLLQSYHLGPLLFLGAKSLPKGASVELQAVLHSGRYVTRDEDDYEVVKSVAPVVEQDILRGAHCVVHVESSIVRESGDFVFIGAIEGDSVEAAEILKSRTILRSMLEQTVSLRGFCKVSKCNEAITLAHELFPMEVCGITVVPVRFVSTRTKDFDVILCGIGTRKQ